MGKKSQKGSNGLCPKGVLKGKGGGIVNKRVLVNDTQLVEATLEFEIGEKEPP